MPRRARKTRKSANKNSMQTIFTRYMLIVAVFIMWIGGISVRLVSLQVNQSEWLREKALNQRRDQIKIKTLRGNIYDRTERTLAMSVKVQSLYADPLEIKDFEGTAEKVAAVLRTSKKNVLEILEEARDKNRRFVWLERKVDDEKVKEINKALEDEQIKKADLPKMAGLHWKEEEKRKYPFGTLASHIIGFANADDVGQAGIEMSKEDILKGEVTKSWRDRDRLGRVYDESEVVERQPPKDIVLTISNSIQYKTEQALEKGVKNSNAKSGMAVVLDPKTGEILAMANYPTFDPNNFNQVKPEVWKNKAVQDVYSPGSIFKVITYGGALEEQVIEPNDTIDGRKGFIKVGKRRFEDPHGMKIMSYGEALAVSSNFAAIKTALGLGKNKFYYYSQNFGFGEKTGIELPAEREGTLRPPERWAGDSLASMSIGYEVSVTALQAASAFAAIANDGLRIKPRIIKEIRDSESKVISTPNPEKIQVLSAEAATHLRGMLKKVVEKGTAKRAKLNGYTSAGKTGTAWKYDPKLRKYNPAKYISSFVGMAPAENPSLVIAIVMDEPSVGARDGGQVSAPVFREIAEQVLPELNVLPAGENQEEIEEPIDYKVAESSEEEIEEIVDLPGEIATEANEEETNKPKIEKPKAIANEEKEDKKKTSEDKKKPPEKKTPAIKKEKPKSNKKKSSDERTKNKT